MAKLTNAQLLARLATLEKENEDLKAEIEKICAKASDNNYRYDTYLSMIQHALPPGNGEIIDRVAALASSYYNMSQDLCLAAELIEPGFKGNIHELLHSKTLLAQAKCTSCDYTPPEVPACVKCGKPNPNHRPKTKIVKVAEEKVVATVKWLAAYVGHQLLETDTFLYESFDAYTNHDRTWLAVYPKPGMRGTQALVSQLNRARFNKGIKGDYWLNDGLWVEVKR